MKKRLFLAGAVFALSLAACSENDDPVASAAAAPEIGSITIADGATDVDPAIGAISIYTTAPLDALNIGAVTLRSEAGDDVALDCTVCNMNLHLTFGELATATGYVLTVPAGALHNVYDAALVNVSETTVRFSTRYETPETVAVDPAAALTDGAATAAAQRLYAYIREQLFLGSRMAVGTMSKYTVEMVEAEWVCEQTGKYPALHCFDLMNLTGKEYVSDYAELLPNASAWANAGGIVAAMWHWRDPSKQTNAFYSSETSFDLSRIVASAGADGSYEYNTEAAEYTAIMEDIAAAKAQLQKLADADIPVLWRPLHEARGTWFWWGNAGADACKALWALLRHELGDLHNLVWVWTIQADNQFGAAQEWYPGDGQVDIVGVDLYAGAHGSFADEYKFAASVSGGKKVIALTECGAMPDVDAMYAEGAAWAYCMPWYGEYTREESFTNSDGAVCAGNGAAYWQRLLTGDYADRVIDRSEVNF